MMPVEGCYYKYHDRISMLDDPRGGMKGTAIDFMFMDYIRMIREGHRKRRHGEAAYPKNHRYRIERPGNRRIPVDTWRGSSSPLKFALARNGRQDRRCESMRQ
jgi:hypothetical protein